MDGRIEQPSIPEPEGAAMSLDRFLVDEQDLIRRQETGSSPPS
jgi:hypothetical protein